MNADYFWISSEQAGLAIAALRSHVVNSQLTEFIFDSEDSSYAMGTFYDEDNSSAMYLLAGDYYEPSNGLYVAALYFYNFNDELTTISYADYLSDKSSLFYDVSKIQGSYVASGVVLVNNEIDLAMKKYFFDFKKIKSLSSAEGCVLQIQNIKAKNA